MGKSITPEQRESYSHMLDSLNNKLGNLVQVSDLTGVDHSALYRHSKGQSGPSPETYEKVEEAYKVVFDGDEPASWAPEPVFPTNGHRNIKRPVIDTLRDARGSLEEVENYLRLAADEYGEFVRLMGLAYDNANPLVAKGIKAAMEELSETRKLLEGV